MKMGVKVYYSEISGHKEVKKRQQRIMMILDSKAIPYQPIDITDPGRESEKDFMLKNGKPRGDSKLVLSPQIFNEEVYCGDYDDFDLANENDTLEEFLNCPRIEKSTPAVPASANTTNGTAASRESSAEKVNESEKANETPAEEQISTENEKASEEAATTEAGEEAAAEGAGDE